MRAKSMVLILIALGCGLVASIAISQVLERGGSGEATVETVQIYVATTDLDMNELLDASNVRVEDWPKTKIPEGAITDFDHISGKFASARLFEGEPILLRKLADEISGAAITIPAGHRVCSLKVEMEAAVSGLLNPGDRVDIVGFFEESKTIPQTCSREILNNVRVFAVNAETEKETDSAGKTIIAKTVSLLVKHDQVARLMLATSLGTLRLALRHPNEVPTEDGNANDTASIESLFGTRSQTADVQGVVPDVVPPVETAPPATTASAGGGFMDFLSGLNGQADPMNLEPTVKEPAWKMVILTPDGGTQFNWADENGMPTIEGEGSAIAPLQPSMPNTARDGIVPPSGPTVGPPEDIIQEPEQEEDGPEEPTTRFGDD